MKYHKAKRVQLWHASQWQETGGVKSAGYQTDPGLSWRDHAAVKGRDDWTEGDKITAQTWQALFDIFGFLALMHISYQVT